jgi:excisionase family DNA binding protein
MPAAVPELIDIVTLAEQLGDSVRHIRRLVADKRIPHLKVGHLIRFDPAEIVAWLDGCRQPLKAGRPAAGEGSRGHVEAAAPAAEVAPSSARKPADGPGATAARTGPGRSFPLPPAAWSASRGCTGS